MTGGAGNGAPATGVGGVRVGAHLSVARGFAAAARRAREYGADLFQYFPKNPKSFRPRRFEAEELRRDGEVARDLGICSVAHSPYVTNLSTPDPDLRETSIRSIVNDLEIAGAYLSEGVVVHCGKHMGEGVEKGLQRMVSAVNEVLERYTGSVALLLENTAGQGSELGYALEMLLELYERIEQRERVGFCIDTCHALAAGLLDPHDPVAFCAALGASGLLPLLRVLHVNDSRMPFGSRRDRHELLGLGALGEAGLATLLQQPALHEVPWIIETPVSEEAEYAGEIARARRWAQGGR